MQVIPNVRTTEDLDPPPRGGGGQADAGPGPRGGRPIPGDGICGQRGFEFGESEIAQKTGIALKLLAKIRRKNLTQGEDWDFANLRVAYSKTGLAALLEKITGAPVTAELENATRLTNGHDPAEPQGVIGTVKKFYFNPRLIGVEVNGQLQPVRVRESKNFELGMEVPLKPAPGGRFELARKCPRFPGRW